MCVKDLNVFELTPGLADALASSLDSSYLEYITADCSGTSTKEGERRIAAIPEEKRYLTRVVRPSSGRYLTYWPQRVSPFDCCY